MKNPKWFVVVNPTSGGGKGKKHWKDIEQLLVQMGIQYDFAFSEHHQHIIELTRNAVLNGYQRIIGVGGDGTANEVINGIFTQNEVPTTDITFALIPVGTGNDWIKTHKIPNNYKKAILLIKAGNTKLQDIGLVHYHKIEDNSPQSRYFLNVAGLGYDAFVTKASMERKRWMSNKLFYLYLILSCTFKYVSRPARVIFNGQTVEEDFYSMAVGVCIYNGGGAQFVPHAIPDDGQFALTLIKKVSVWEVVKNTGRFYNGKIGDNPKVALHTTPSLRVEPVGDQPTWLEVDGEFLGQAPADFETLHKALNIIVP